MDNKICNHLLYTQFQLSVLFGIKWHVFNKWAVEILLGKLLFVKLMGLDSIYLNFLFFCFNSSAIHTQFLKRIIYSWSFTIIRKLVEHWPSLLMACVRSNVLSYIYIFLRLFIVHDSLWKQNKTKQEGYHLSNNVVAFFVDHYISTA